MNKYNLTDILSKELIIEEQDSSKSYKFEGIQIPMIQRDYAQGREEEVEIRNRFLKSIFNALVKDENLELDFVYGSIKELDSKIHFIPLDGQQRLTTLFLLHWYIGKRELNINELNLLLTTLKGFTYATRSSARDFCEKLIDISLSFKEGPKKEITNSAWFYGRFEKDPTVKAMLIMLDAIHSYYNQELAKNASINLFASLSKMSFYILPLGGFNLSDELYIKMNARGKQLTDFENFKADLVNWIRDEKNPNSVKFQMKVTLNNREMPYHLAFATKLDNSWSHLFWEYIQQYKTDSKNIDIFYLRFWNRFLLNNHITSSLELPDVIEKGEIFKKLYGNEDNELDFKYEGFEFYQQLFEKQDVVLNAQQTLDGLSENFIEIQKCLQPVWALKDSWNLFDEKINQRQRILFLAISLYVRKNTFDIGKFKNWIRVVWNIIIDPDIRSIFVMISIMRIIDKLSAGSGDIYKFLSGPDLLVIIQNETSFVKAQLEEEKLKAELIISNPSWETELISAEKHQLFQGSIGFLLLSSPEFAQFEFRLKIANLLFNSKGSNNEYLNNHKLTRALICKFHNWNELFKLDFADNYNNWQLLLRRNIRVKEIVCVFCDSDNEKVLSEEIDNYITSESSIQGYADTPEIATRIDYVHKQLYADEKLHIWCQQKGATKLRKRGERIYIDRLGSWYDRVMIDTYRNKLISRLIDKFNLTTSQKCTDSYYWGTAVELFKTFESFNFTLAFDDIENLRIGIKDDGKSLQIDNLEFNTDEVVKGWICRRKYNYNKIASEEDIDLIIQLIEDEIFSNSNTSSLLNKIQSSKINN